MRKQLNDLVRLTKKHITDIKRSGIDSVEAGDHSPRVTRGARSALSAFCENIKECRKCPLSETRANFVFGEGAPESELVFIGEAPGHDEDLQGRPFVGRAGQLLTKIIEAMGYKREDVYICNTLKCRPPENRPPRPEETEACRPHLERQLALLGSKKVICCMGLHAARAVLLLGTEAVMKDMRGNWYKYGDTPVMVTYHPAYLLRSPNEKIKVWNDMKKIKQHLRK